MKYATHLRRGVLSKLLLSCAVPLGIVAGSWHCVAVADTVDTELVWLVDVTKLKDKEFSAVKEGYASAMTSAQVLDTIASGAVGKIAVMMTFYGDDIIQSVGVPWMVIGSAAEAANFATAARDAVMPKAGKSALAPVLASAVETFGSETGAPDNGHTSAVQVIEVVAVTEPKDLIADLQSGRTAALAAGVDVINAMTIGKKASELESYYATNVIGGEAGGVAASVSSSAIDAGLASSLITHLDTGLEGTAAASIAIPEPRVTMILLCVAGIHLLCFRGRRWN